MSNILIGSKAIQYHIPDYRECNDIDIATLDVKKTQIINKIIYEFKPIPALFNYINECVKVNHIYVPSLNVIYTLKCSHLSWDINWGKNAKDVMFLESYGCVIIPDLYDELYKYWQEIHKSKKHIKLNCSNTDFFKNNVNYIQDHDGLHEKYKFYHEPLYKQCKKDLNKAILNKDIFDTWDLEKQLNLVIEEAFVIAEERFKFDKNKSIKYIITNLTRGWFNKFTIINLNKICQKLQIQQIQSK